MKKIKVLLIITLISFSATSQNQLTGSFENLVGSKWRAEGTWSDGSTFKTEKDFEWGLDGRIVKVKTYGIVNPQTKEYGLRNDGVRAYDASDSTFKFFEFDVFGGITIGIVSFREKDILYDYEYQGMLLRDEWKYINPGTYNYTVGIFKDDGWEKVFHQSQFTRVEE